VVEANRLGMSALPKAIWQTTAEAVAINSRCLSRAIPKIAGLSIAAGVKKSTSCFVLAADEVSGSAYLLFIFMKGDSYV